MVVSQIEKSRQDIKSFRKTHIDWAEYFEANPDIERVYIQYRHFDSAKEHRRIVECYDEVLKLLDKLEEMKDWGTDTFYRINYNVGTK